jgi:membrane-associated phospholipid phosphatase
MNIRILVFIFFLGSEPILAQQITAPDTVTHQTQAVKRNFWKGTIAPAALIGLGLYTIHDNGLYSSHDASYDARKAFPNFSSSADDFVFFIPVVGLYAFDYFSSQNRNHVGRQTLLLFSSAAVMGALVYPLKLSTNVDRPNDENNHSFPSGHTAAAFVVAGVINQEFKGKSPWISVGAYTIAGSTGVMRILNNAHWMSDVFAGAGIGLLSVHSVYFLHERFLKNKNVTLLPTTPFGGQGFTLLANF